MRISSAIAGAFALLLTIEVFAQATEHTIPVVWNPGPIQNPGSCSFFLGTMSATFDDSAGSNWSYLKVRIPLAVALTQTGQQPPAPPATVSIAINGVPIGSPVLVSNTSGFCGPYITYEFGMQSPLTGYRPFTQNTFTITSSGGHAGNSGEPAELIFRTEPRRLAFDLVPAMLQKVILHPKPGDTNLSPWQVATNLNEKPRFRFRGAVSSSTATLEADVWLRVVDPVDPSPYVPQAERVPDDNRDPSPKGVLMPRGCADPGCRAAPGQPLQVRSSAGGVVEAELEATDRYAGDNYYLEASFDPTFTCAMAGANGTNICARSGHVTAWKRVFIDRLRMLRNGMRIEGTFGPGSTSIRVRGNRYGGNRGRDRLSRGDEIILVHAPAIDRRNLAEGWYAEPHNILAVTDNNDGTYTIELGFRERGQVWQESLQHEFGDDPINSALGDAIARVDGLALTPDDVFDASTDLVTNGPLQEAYTEYVFLNTPSSSVPLPRFFVPNDERLLQSFVEKWSSVVINNGGGFAAPENHQLLVVAAAGGGNAGFTISQVPGKTSSFVFRETINREAGTRGVDAERWAMKTMAHEIAHQWWTNGFLWGPDRFDHCPPDTRTFEPSSLFYCLLADATATGSETQRANGIARFHLLPDPRGGWHSEYYEIRRRPDPFTP